MLQQINTNAANPPLYPKPGSLRTPLHQSPIGLGPQQGCSLQDSYAALSNAKAKVHLNVWYIMRYCKKFKIQCGPLCMTSAMAVEMFGDRHCN